MALRGALMKRGRMEEVRAAWAAAVAAEPPEHEAWDGYAELCLFLGNEGEYRRVRRALLARFGGAGAQVAERTGRACLLAPGSPEEIAQAAALVDRALSADKKEYPEWAYPYFLVAKGLADYRSGRFADSANLMRGEASKVLIPAPQLVLAMDLYRLGRGDEARAALAGAVLNYDWRSSEADNREVWMYHALRREAERMLLPNLPAFLEGKYQPRSNDERLALIGACQFHNRFGLAARLYADAFAADPRLEEDFGARRRYGAARMAALAGCGRDEDAARDGHAGERLWRTRARQWLRADLAAWIRYADGSPADADRVRDELQRWRDEPDLAGLRKPAELDRLSADERADCLSLWKEVDAVFKRKPAGK
jgi:serine/threonine-protein kinase